jgi:HD-GYP domain-containing protein (c-di-GMP phosphodiesterase class II)
MAIADILEALAAGDRPYKKGKTLNEALQTLGHMKVSGHIDPTCSTTSCGNASTTRTPRISFRRNRDAKWTSPLCPAMRLPR